MATSKKSLSKKPNKSSGKKANKPSGTNVRTTSARSDERAFVLIPVRVKVDAIAVVPSDGTAYKISFPFERYGQSEKVEGTIGFLFPGGGQLVPDELLGYLKKDKQVQLVASLGKDAQGTKLIAWYVRIQQTDFALHPTIDVLPVPKKA